MSRGRFGLGVLCVLCVLCGDPASAHDLGTSESRLDVDGANVRAVVYLNVAEFAGLDEDGNGRVSVDELDRRIAGIFAQVKQHYDLSSGTTPPATITPSGCRSTTRSRALCHGSRSGRLSIN
jgi:hypothetical protein